MKKFKSLALVALGMLTLASCSNDDLFGEKVDTQAEDLSQYDMIVYQGSNGGGAHFTRAYAGAMFNDYTWTKMDRIHVFDDELHKYDIYKFGACLTQGGAGFHRENIYANVNGQAKYALYPHEDVIRGYWLYNESSEQKKTVAEININPNMVYDATLAYDDKNNATPIYKDVLPQWGAVEFNGDHLKTTMNYLTAGLRVPLAQYIGHATAIKVQVLNPETEEYLPIAGTFEAVLSEGKQKMIVNENAYAKYLNEPSSKCFSEVVDAPTSTGATAIYIDLKDASMDLSSLSAEERARAVLWVPLPDTEGTPVIIEISSTNDDFTADFNYTVNDQMPDPDRNRSVLSSGMYACDYEMIWKSKEPEALLANNFYGPKNYYNYTVGGIDTNAINEALEDATPVDRVVELTTADPITICGNDNTIIIPTERNEDTDEIILDLRNGLGGCKEDETLHIVYEDPEQPFPGNVTLITPDKTVEGFDAYDLDVDTDLPASGFAIAGERVDALDVDATEFVIGNGDVRTWIEGEYMTLSDNVQALTIDEWAMLTYDDEDYCALVVKEAAPGLETLNIYGTLFGGVDALESVVNVTVKGVNKPAEFLGGIRTQGTITAEGKAILASGEPFCIPGMAAFGDVTIKDKAFAIGSILSKDGDIIINNVDLNEYDYFGGNKLSDLVYETLGEGPEWNKVKEMFEEKEIEYGPLYAEAGSVKVTAHNSDLIISSNVVDATYWKDLLNENAQHAIEFSVYAKKDIEFSGDKSTIKGKMWAENDVRLSGQTTAKDGIRVDNDFSIIEQSKAKTVKVGHNATVNVDAQDGNCVAITKKLIFVENDLGNALALEQGYIAEIENGTAAAPVEVQLAFSTTPAYAAIGTATAPTAIIPQNESKWNGKQMPTDLVETYIGSDPYIFTATELAYQTVAPTTTSILLQSNINLMDELWPGINSLNTQTLVSRLWTNKTVSNVNLRGHGFFNILTDAHVYGLTLKNVKQTAQVFDRITSIIKNELLEQIIPDPQSDIINQYLGGYGALAGAVYGENTISNVTVVLKGRLGSDGVNNKQCVAIGGLLGADFGETTLRGVRVNATDGSLGGWCYLGGLIGYAAGDITIADAGQYTVDTELGTTIDMPSAITKVGNLTVNVTYCDADPEGDGYINDMYQGATGLYIGGAVIVNEEYSYIITATGNKAADAANFTLVDAQEEYAFINDGNTKRYTFLRSQSQNLIGNSGFESSEATIKIGKKDFEVKKGATEVTEGYYPLYFVKLSNLQTQQP